MKHIPSQSAIEHQNSAECIVYEYGDNGRTDVARAVINGRYPTRGFALNEISAMTLFVIDGRGIVATKEDVAEVKPGDVLFIKEKEPYYYEGDDLSIVMVSDPSWSPDQYQVVE